MSTTDTDFDPESLIGPLAAQDYGNVSEGQQPRLRAWIERLPSLTDDELSREAGLAICDVAHANACRQPYDESHVRASAASHESGQRMLRAGHVSEWCGPSIYTRAYHRALREFGYGSGKDDSTCRCEKTPN